MKLGWIGSALCAALCLCGPAHSAEKYLDFSGTAPGQSPAGWTPVRVGGGKEGDWKVVLVDVPPVLKPINPGAPNLTRRSAVTQEVADPTDERFPMLVYGEEKFGDFEARVRFQIAGGGIEQMAGLAFRMQDPGNFYVVRLSALGSNIRFYKFVNGERSAPIGPEYKIGVGEWHDLTVKCTGNRIDVLMDGKPAMPTLTDNSHATGSIALFTKSDSRVYFSDVRLEYRPLETLAMALVKHTLDENPRLLDLQILGRKPGSKALEVLAAKTAGDVGRKASDVEEKVWAENRTWYTKTKTAAVVTHPLRDRNGEVLGVVRFGLKPFAGQMEGTTVARVLPMVKDMQTRIGAAMSLVE